MKSRIEDIGNYFGTALLMVLFIFMVAAFSDGSNQQSIKPVPLEFVSEWNSKSAQAILNPDEVQLPAIQINQVSVIDKLSLHLFNPTFKRSADNRMFARRFLALQQTELDIKPFILCRFYDPLLPHVADDVPVLS